MLARESCRLNWFFGDQANARFAPRIREISVRRVHCGEQPFRRDAVEISEWSWTRALYFGGQFTRLARFQRRHEQPGQGSPGDKGSQWGGFKPQRCRRRTVHACVMHRDVDPDPVSGHVVKQDVRSFHAEFSKFSFIPGTDFEFRPFFHNSHSIPFHRNRSAAASGAVRSSTSVGSFAPRTPQSGIIPTPFPFPQAAYCFDIGHGASSHGYLTPKLAKA